MTKEWKKEQKRAKVRKMLKKMSAEAQINRAKLILKRVRNTEARQRKASLEAKNRKK